VYSVVILVSFFTRNLVPVDGVHGVYVNSSEMFVMGVDSLVSVEVFSSDKIPESVSSIEFEEFSRSDLGGALYFSLVLGGGNAHYFLFF